MKLETKDTLFVMKDVLLVIIIVAALSVSYLKGKSDGDKSGGIESPTNTVGTVTNDAGGLILTNVVTGTETNVDDDLNAIVPMLDD